MHRQLVRKPFNALEERTMKTPHIAFVLSGLLLTTNAFADGFSPWRANKAADGVVGKSELTSRSEILSTGFSPWTVAKPAVEKADTSVARTLNVAGFHPWS